MGDDLEHTDIEEMVGQFDTDEGVKAYLLLEARLRKRAMLNKRQEERAKRENKVEGTEQSA